MTTSISEPERRRRAILDRARALGFDALGVAPAAAPEIQRERLAEFLAAGRHGDMTWMAERSAQRADPAALWPDAKSVVMLGLNYGPARDPLDALRKRTIGAISVYAQGKDYHDVAKPRLKALARWLVETEGGDVKVFVDTAPVMEKPLGQRAGLGWQGKHTNLVSRDFGSWLFLGAVFSTLDIAPDDPETDHCGECRRCLDICPTKAFPTPYRLDARRCISYLTIEHKGPIPLEFREAIGNRIYGCDDCLAVCPWNKFAQTASEAAFHAREKLIAPDLAELARLDDASFRRMFAGSPIKRIGRDRFVRNVLIAIGNSGDPRLADAAVERLNDGAAVVCDAAVWACERLLGTGYARDLDVEQSTPASGFAMQKEDLISPVRITHDREQIWLGEVRGPYYNYLVYEFETEQHLFRARAYLDEIDTVSVFGPFEKNSTILTQIEGVGIDPRILAYLRRRYSTIQVLGPTGYVPIR